MTLNTNPGILDRLTFNLDWWADADIRAALRGEYLLDDFAFDDENLMEYFMQHKSDDIAEYWNEMYQTTKYVYNPLFNVDGTETITRTITGTKSNTRTVDLTDTRTPNLETKNNGVIETITNGTETTTHYDSPVNSESFKSTDKTVLEHTPSTSQRDGSVKLTGTETNTNAGTDTNVESFDNYTEKTVTERGGNIGVTMTQQLIDAQRKILIKIREMYLAEYAEYFIITM